MRLRSALTSAWLGGWAALVVAAASCGTQLSIAADPADGSGDGNVVVGAEGGSVADGAVSSGCDGGLATDPANCGACGHSCGTSACVDGLCEPAKVQLASGAAFQDGAHVAVRGATGVMTDGLPFQGGGQAGYVYRFDPTATPPAAQAVVTAQYNASLAAAGASQGYWTHTADTELSDQANSNVVPGAGNRFIALAASPSGQVIAARIDTGIDPQEIRIYDAPLVLRKGFYVSAPAKGRGVAFVGEDSVLVAVNGGIDRCSFAGAAVCVPVAASPPSALHVAVSGSDIFFTNVPGELRRGSLAGPLATTVLMSDVLNARAVAAEPMGAYVLDDNGIRTTRYGAPLVLVKPGAGKIFDFALAPPWLYFITPTGLYRIHI